MASIKVKFRPSTTPSREGTIYYQIIHERIVRQLHTTYKIHTNEWDAQKSVLIILPDSERRSLLLSIREHIKWDLRRFHRIIEEYSLSHNTFTSDDIIKEYTERQRQLSFFNFMESVIIKLRTYERHRTTETYTVALNSLRRFRNNHDILIDEFSSDLMEDYEAYLTNQGLIPNSRSFHMRILRAVYNRAVEKGITENRHPFRHVYTGVDKTPKRALDIKSLKKIKDANLSMSPKADFARDIFMLSFYFRGMSFIDMAYLTKKDLYNGYITYRRRKTGQQLSIKWTPQMQKIIDKYPKNETPYLLPLITSSKSSARNQYKTKQYLVNHWLKKVAEQIGLKISLTMYCSRHSWASIAKAKGIPLGVISDGLGHDNEHTTQIYLSTLDTNAVDKANALIMKLF